MNIYIIAALKLLLNSSSLPTWIYFLLTRSQRIMFVCLFLCFLHVSLLLVEIWAVLRLDCSCCISCCILFGIFCCWCCFSRQVNFPGQKLQMLSSFWCAFSTTVVSYHSLLTRLPRACHCLCKISLSGKDFFIYVAPSLCDFLESTDSTPIYSCFIGLKYSFLWSTKPGKL